MPVPCNPRPAQWGICLQPHYHMSNHVSSHIHGHVTQLLLLLLLPPPPPPPPPPAAAATQVQEDVDDGPLVLQQLSLFTWAKPYFLAFPLIAIGLLLQLSVPPPHQPLQPLPSHRT